VGTAREGNQRCAGKHFPDHEVPPGSEYLPARLYLWCR
jgi:hypothetical protein